MLGLVIPLYDEVEVCEPVIRALHRAFAEAGQPLRLMLVDNGSTDGTGPLLDRLAAELGHEVLHLSPNAGYGGGILAGLSALSTPYLGWSWGDGQISAEAVLAVWRACGPGVLAKARRTRREDGWKRLLNSWIYNRSMRGLFAVRSDDVNGCPKMMERALFQRLALESRDWWLDPECVLKVQALGVELVEVDTVMLPRAGGASKVKLRTNLEFVRRMVTWRLGRR